MSLEELAKELGTEIIYDCQICGKSNTFLWPCQECEGAFCDDHAGQKEHGCSCSVICLVCNQTFAYIAKWAVKQYHEAFQMHLTMVHSHLVIGNNVKAIRADPTGESIKMDVEMK